MKVQWYAWLHLIPVEKAVLNSEDMSSFDSLDLSRFCWLEVIRSGIWVTPQGEAQAEGLLFQVWCWCWGRRVLPTEGDHLFFGFFWKILKHFNFGRFFPKPAPGPPKLQFVNPSPPPDREQKWLGFKIKQKVHHVGYWKHIFKVQVCHKCTVIIFDKTPQQHNSDD